MSNSRYRTLCQLSRLTALLLFASSLRADWTVYAEGHLDLRMLYDATPASGFQIRIFDVNSERLIDPAEATLRVNGDAAIERPNASTWEATGTAAGAPLWVLPQSLTNGLLWVGTRAAIADEIFRPLPPAPVFGSGQIALRLVAVEGSGVEAGGSFALFSTDLFGFPTFAWATADGIGENDLIAPINTSSHTHYNWAFTQPGDYRITIEAIGYSRADGTALTTRAEVHFQVLPEASAPATDLKLSVADGDPFLHWQRPSGAVPVVLWRSDELGRWWIEAVVEPPATQSDLHFPNASKAAFWRVSDPLSAP